MLSILDATLEKYIPSQEKYIQGVHSYLIYAYKFGHNKIIYVFSYLRMTLRSVF